MNKKSLGIIVLIAVIVIVFYAVGGTSKTVQYESLVEEANAIVVADQQPDEEEVIVHYAKLSQPGYVIIYGVDATTGSTTNEVIAVSPLLEAGEYKNLPVTKTVKSGYIKSNKVVARLVVDNGDGAFDVADDAVAADESGEAVESDAVISEDVEDADVQTDEQIVDLLEEEGYTVNEEALDQGSSDEMTDDAMMEDGDDAMMDEGDDAMMDDGSDQMMDDSASTSTDSMEEAPASM